MHHLARRVASAALAALAGCTETAAPALDATVADVARTPDVAVTDDVVDPTMCPAPLGTPAPFAPPTQRLAMDDTLRMNHLQAKATHNSYHIRPMAQVVDWAYTHRPLAEQLESQGVRGVELDLYDDEVCHRLRVLHLPVIDPLTTCDLFTDCLTQLRGWSVAHPGHHPLFIHLEPKFGADPMTDEARMLQVEREILSVFPREAIVTPGEVQGDADTLAHAVETRGWPTLGASRGRVLFYVDRSDGLRDTYTHGGRDLRGRLMFIDSSVGDPFAAMLILNDPVGDAAEIRRGLMLGYIVRTRADSSPATAMANEVTQRDAALASGAQLVSTDFPAPVTGLAYHVEIADGTPSRCSSVTAPAGCTARAIEDPTRLAR